MPGYVGKRELRQKWSKYLTRVEAGEVIGVTDRGKLMFYLVPKNLMSGKEIEQSEAHMFQERLENAGLGRRSRRDVGKLSDISLIGPGTVADIVAEDRDRYR